MCPDTIGRVLSHDMSYLQWVGPFPRKFQQTAQLAAQIDNDRPLHFM